VQSDWIILCDSAYTDAEGKPCLIGVFDALKSASVPATHPRMFVAFRLTGDPNERAEITLELVEPGGTVIATVQGNAVLSPTGTAHTFIRFDQFPIRHFGIYEVRASIGGRVSKRITFVTDRIP